MGEGGEEAEGGEGGVVEGGGEVVHCLKGLCCLRCWVSCVRGVWMMLGVDVGVLRGLGLW